MNKFFMIRCLLALATCTMFVACGGSGSDPISSTTVTAKVATIAPPSANTVSNVSNQEVGRFALSPDGDIRITKLVVINEGTAGLSSLVDPSSMELWDVISNKKVSAQTSITGNVITFDAVSQDIAKEVTINLKVVLTSVKQLEGYYGKTVKFTLNSVTAISATSGLPVGVIGIPLVMKEYTIGMTPPVVLVSGYNPLTQNAPVAKVRVTNVDSSANFAVSSVSMNLAFRTGNSGRTFSSIICLRELGSVSPCGSFGTTAGVLVTESGGSVTFMMRDLVNLGTLTKNGGYTEFEVYLENAPLWVAGDNISVAVRSLTTSNGSEYSYVGVSGASATATK